MPSSWNNTGDFGECAIPGCLTYAPRCVFKHCHKHCQAYHQAGGGYIHEAPETATPFNSFKVVSQNVSTGAKVEIVEGKLVDRTFCPDISHETRCQCHKGSPAIPKVYIPVPGKMVEEL